MTTCVTSIHFCWGGSPPDWQYICCLVDGMQCQGQKKAEDNWYQITQCQTKCITITTINNLTNSCYSIPKISTDELLDPLHNRQLHQDSNKQNYTNQKNQAKEGQETCQD